jgi:elongation factor G
VEPKRIQDHDRLFDSLGKLSDEDPTFKFKIDDETGQMIISGMGELHLDIIVTRLKREFFVETNQGKPQVVFRETITLPVEHEEVFERELAGQQHFAGVKIEIAPTNRGVGNGFVNQCQHEALTEEYLDIIRQGIEEAELSGVSMGYPIIDVLTTLRDVQVKETSDAMAFKAATIMAYRNACRKAHPILLEPIMEAEILVPEDFTGEVIADLNARQGKVEQITTKKTSQVLTASVPLSKMFGYSTALRSVSQGRGSFSMQFKRYDKV